MAKLYSYTLEHFFRDFTEEEIVDGLELALSSPLSDFQERANAGILRTHGIPYFSKEKLSILHSQWPSDNSDREETAEIYLDEPHNELILTSCTCRQFAKSHYACPHITSLLCSYLMKTNGHEIFLNTPLAAKLAQKTGVNNPFLPGILQKTDIGVSRLLASAATPVTVSPDFSSNGPLGVECYLLSRNGGAYLELKIGSRRKYVVKSLYEFLKAIACGNSYTLGKETIEHMSLDLFDPSSKALIRFLLELDFFKSQTSHYHSLYISISGNYQRYLYLEGRDLDSLMELLNRFNGEIPVSFENEKIFINFDQNLLQLSMKKQPYGVILSAGEFQTAFSTSEWHYLSIGKTLFRIPGAKADMLTSLLNLLTEKPTLYIRDQDLPQFLGQTSKQLETYTQLSTTGFELDDYSLETPKFHLYLDLPQEDLISCQVKCYYSRKDREYLLYDQTDVNQRNMAVENQLKQKINVFFDAYDETNKAMCLTCADERMYQFLTQDLPKFSEFGEVFVSDALQKLRVRPLPPVNVGIRLDTGLLHMSLTSSDLSQDELIELLSSYSTKKKFHRLKNGSFITFDPEQAQQWSAMSESFLQYGKKHPENMAIPLFRSMYLDEVLKNHDQIQLSENRQYKELLLNMDYALDNDYPVPESLKALLRPYQAEGFRWIKTLKQCGFGGILADDMGLGKTLQTLAFLLSEKRDGKTGDSLRTLIITPASLVYNWKKEIARFTPELTCKVLTGTATARQELIGPDNDADIWITSYDLLKRDIALYEDIIFANQIIDEAQYIKNHSTQASKAVRLIQSSFRLALTGTPIENQLSELWSIFDYLMPGFLYNYPTFKNRYESAIVNDQDKETSDRLRRLVHPFILRRLKKDVLKELPDKIEKVVSVHLEGEQKKLYDAYAQRLKLYLAKQSPEEFRQSKLEILKELTRLRQLCCGPSLFLEHYHGENAKLDTCMELVKQAIENGHKILLFSQFTSVLDELQKAFKHEQIKSHRIDGGVSKEERIRLTESFATDDTPVFCISLKAGGTGLNLTAADIVIHYDPWWNVAAQNQATDRTHRIGQKNIVTVYELIAEATIEEQILNLQKAKSDLVEEILSGDGIKSTVLNRDELLQML